MNNKYIASLAMLLMPGAWAAQPLVIDLSAGISRDDNITRASLEQDVESDSIASLEASASQQVPLDTHSFITLDGHVELHEYRDFDALSNRQVGGRAGYHFQFSSGFTAPWYRLALGYDIIDYDSRLRDADRITAELGVGKRLTDRLSLRSGLVYETTDADENTFDIDNTHVYLHGDYTLNQDNTLYASIGYTDGNITAVTGDTTTAPSAKTGGIDSVRYGHHIPGEITVNLIRDDAFMSLSPNRFVYRLDATTWSLTLGDNHAFDHHQAIDLSVLFYTSDTYADDYDGMITQLNYLYRF